MTGWIDEGDISYNEYQEYKKWHIEEVSKLNTQIKKLKNEKSILIAQYNSLLHIHRNGYSYGAFKKYCITCGTYVEDHCLKFCYNCLCLRIPGVDRRHFADRQDELVIIKNPIRRMFLANEQVKGMRKDDNWPWAHVWNNCSITDLKSLKRNNTHVYKGWYW